MAATRVSSPQSVSGRITVETPEHVQLEFELAGFGSRIAAAAFDFAVQASIILMVVLLAGLVAPGIARRASAGWMVALLSIVAFLVIWGYGTLFEGLTGGRTPGKRRLGIRVVTDTGHPVTFSVAAIRNLMRLVDLQPFGSHLIGLLMLLFHRHSRRLGDIVAGTIVVRDETEQITLADAPEPTTVQAIDLGPPLVPDALYQLLERFVGRLHTLDAGARQRVGTDLARRLEEFVARDAGDAETYLITVYEAERDKRHAKAATRAGSSGARTAGTGERFVALRRDAWERFRTAAAALNEGAMSRADGAAMLAFARDYRAVAADLARARTYGVDRRVLAYLERVVSAGHNALYGLSGVKRIPLGRLLFDLMPAAVYDARRLVLVATLAFALPGVAGYAVIRDRPTVAADIMPAGIVGRAEAGAADRAAGLGYAQAPSPYLPLFASSIITNNVQVAFLAFALGALAGVGTLAVLVFNGLFFGSVIALFENYGLATWILTFVAGHGVLELTAIFIAGGAGLLIGKTIIAPGDLARRDALIVHGRHAIRLVGASACLLVLAGLIEGFLSASDAPTAVKLATSAVSAVLLLLLYAQGRGASRAAPS